MDRSRGLALVVAVGTVAGCHGGSLGARCTGEVECPYGLACFAPFAGPGACTVKCAETPCDDGVCLATSTGTLCARPCSSMANCEAGTHCQRAGHLTGCWFNDPALVPVPERLFISSVQVLGYGGRGRAGLPRGDFSSVLVSLTNGSGAAVDQIRPAITTVTCSSSPCAGVSVSWCDVGLIRCSAVAGACACPDNGQRYPSLLPGKPSPLLSLDVYVERDARVEPVHFTATFVVGSERETFTESFSVAVLP